MRKFLLPTAAAVSLTLASALTAKAHSTLEQAEAPNGGYKAVIRVPHGCDGQPTIGVKVELPEGFIGAKPMPKPGWTLTLDKGDYAKTYKLHGKDVLSGLKVVTWSGGELPDDQYDEFVVNGTLSAEAGARLPFVVTQTCPDGKVAWNEIAAEGQDPHSLKHPAPFVTIAQDQGHDAHGGHMMGAAGATASARAGDLDIAEGWARAMLPGQPAGGAYLTVTNHGAQADRLISVSSPLAGTAEVHEMKMTDNVMTMRPVEGGLEIPAGATVELKPGGYHLMFMQVKSPFTAGGSVPVTLEFEKAGKVDIALPVRDAKGMETMKH